MLNGNSKSSSTKESIRREINFHKKWIEYQFTREAASTNIELNLVKSVCTFDISKDKELREAFKWKNTQPLLKALHSRKGPKFIFVDYQLHFLKAYQFFRLNGERNKKRSSLMKSVVKLVRKLRNKKTNLESHR